MPSPRPRSNKRRAAGTSHGTTRPPAQQRTKDLSPRALLLVAIGLATLAALVDWLACAFTLSEFRTCGHLHFDIMLTGLGLTLTIVAVYALRLWWKARRATTPKAPRPPAGTKA